ncbi:MAG: hypothetical protein AMXMBFR58_04240 [Phycisphaerae bacterium]
MTRDEIYAKVREILADTLSVDEEDIQPTSTLKGDLGAESIDYLDISFQLEKGFGFKIGQNELFPQGVAQDPKYVKDGRVTPEGIAALVERLPHFNFDRFKQDAQLSKIHEIFTVDSIVNFVQAKVAAKG